jgi:hypothetical protein
MAGTGEARSGARIDALDAWLDRIHGLAAARLVERRALAQSGRDLRVRLLHRDR